MATERRNPRTMDLHALSVEACIERINIEDRHAFDAVKRARTRISTFVEAIEPGFIAGGRLIYVGAGTSGRLGVLDASEAPPTFHVPPDRIIGLIAGGDSSLRKSSESKEDDAQGAWSELEALKLTDKDTVLAIAAGGTTPYAVGALEFCKTRTGTSKPTTALLCCTTIERPPHCDHLIMLRTGPEVLTGSTRMKAGTATKLTLNLISTTLMIRSGRVYQNLMVDLKATNQKLRDRAARIIATLTGLNREDSLVLLDRAHGDVKVAVVMHSQHMSPSIAAATLAQHGGHLARVLGDGAETPKVADEADEADTDQEETNGW
ncbi:MAG: N-acetylmuramic acid 6-phosphate etherase [Planctomycetota bacterium]|nr:N-acetylmuramic acid 6-phosphate etherase [Planctomycetota bacterium]